MPPGNVFEVKYLWTKIALTINYQNDVKYTKIALTA
jgi:hypothetical protein